VERADFESHVGNCRDCREELESVRALSRIVGNDAAPGLPNSLRVEILRIPSRTERVDMLPTAKALASVAALLLVISIGFSSKLGDWPIGGEGRALDSVMMEEWDSEALEEPEAEVTHWVVAGLSE